METTTTQRVTQDVETRSPAPPQEPQEKQSQNCKTTELVSFYARNALGFAVADQTNAFGITTLVRKAYNFLPEFKFPGVTSDAVNTFMEEGIDATSKVISEKGIKASTELLNATGSGWFGGFSPIASTKNLFSSMSGKASQTMNYLCERKFQIGVSMAWGLTHSGVEHFLAKKFPEMNANYRSAASFAISGAVVFGAVQAGAYVQVIGSGVTATDMVVSGFNTVVANQVLRQVDSIYHALTRKKLPSCIDHFPTWNMSFPKLAAARQLKFD